jgi:hypothetical protein
LFEAVIDFHDEFNGRFLEQRLEVPKNKGIHRAPNDWSFELTREGMIDFFFRNEGVTFGVLSNPVRNLWM